MNNEKYNQIIDEVGQKYTKWWYDNAIPSSNGKPKLDGEGILTRGEFINRIKTDPEFSEKWGLMIEERELSLDERNDYYTSNYLGLDCETHEELNKLGDIPTKLITVTYNNETIEVYE